MPPMPRRPTSPRALEQARARLDDALAITPDNVRLLVLRARADERTGRYAEAAGFYQRAARLCRASGDRSEEAQAMLGCGNALSRAGFDGEAREAFHRAIACFELLEADRATATARLALARHELANQHSGAARQQLEGCRIPLAVDESFDDLGWVCDRLVDIAVQDDDVQRALAHARAGVEAAAKAQDRAAFGRRLATVGGLHRQVGHAAKARGYLTRALPYLRDGDQRGPLLGALSDLSHLARALGAIPEATEHLDEALVVADHGAATADSVRIRLQLADVLAQGRPRRARDLIQQAIALLDESRDSKALASAWLDLAAVQGLLGDALAARSSLEHAHVLFEALGDDAGRALAMAGLEEPTLALEDQIDRIDDPHDERDVP